MCHIILIVLVLMILRKCRKMAGAIKKFFDVGKLHLYATEGSSIELNRTSTGKHSWSIKIYGDNPKKILPGVIQIDKDLELLYGESLPESEGSGKGDTK